MTSAANIPNKREVIYCSSVPVGSQGLSVFLLDIHCISLNKWLLKTKGSERVWLRTNESLEFIDGTLMLNLEKCL